MNKKHLEGRGGHNFNRGGQEGITEKMTYEQRPEGGERRSHVDTRNCILQKEQPAQRL